MVSALELQSIVVAGTGETNSTPVWVEIELPKRGKSEGDEAVLARLGKRQSLRRNFDFVSTVAFTCLMLLSWEGIYTTFTAAVYNGGPGTTIYGFLIIFIGTLSTFVSIGELASIAPTAGGQYHWVYMLGPTRSRRILSFLTGWMMVLSWQGLVATATRPLGTIVDNLLVLNYPGYQSETWRTVMYSWALVALTLVANTFGSILLPVVHCTFFLLHMLGFVAVFIILCYVTPHGTVEEVFSSSNGGDWPTQGVSSIVGVTSMVYALLGGDAAVHLSEEIYNAPINVPRSMLLSILLNGLMGVGVMVPTVFGLVVFGTDDLQTGDGASPFIPIFNEFTGNKEGSTVICSLILALTVSSLACSITTSSRMIWAFARDRGLPFSEQLCKIDNRISEPLNAVLLTTFISALLTLLSFAPSLVFDSLLSLSVAGFYSTYLTSIGLLLWRRVKHDIKEQYEVNNEDPTVTDIDSGTLSWGPWRVKGWLGTANNLFACTYLLFIAFFSLWPAQVDVGATSLNYSIVVVAVVLLYSVCYYFLVGRRRYDGPVLEIVI